MLHHQVPIPRGVHLLRSQLHILHRRPQIDRDRGRWYRNPASDRRLSPDLRGYVRSKLSCRYTNERITTRSTLLHHCKAISYTEAGARSSLVYSLTPTSRSEITVSKVSVGKYVEFEAHCY